MIVFFAKKIFFFLFDFNQWFFYKNQVILIVIKIGDLNHADLNRPTLVPSKGRHGPMAPPTKPECISAALKIEPGTYK